MSSRPPLTLLCIARHLTRPTMLQVLHQEPNLGGVQVLPPWDGGPGIYYGAALSAPALQSGAHHQDSSSAAANAHLLNGTPRVLKPCLSWVIAGGLNQAARVGRGQRLTS